MPLLSGGAIPIQSCWNYIFNLLNSNLNVGQSGGQLVPGTGANSGGKLQTVLAVGKQAYPDVGALPWVGVDPPLVRGKKYAARRKDWIEMDFTVSAAVNVVAAGEGLLLLADAWKALADIIDDGNGNGVQPILRNDLTLGGNAIMSMISEVRPGWGRSPASGSSYIAWMELVITVSVEAQS